MKRYLTISSVVLMAVLLSTLAFPAEEEITLKNPEGLTFDSEDNLVVADTGNNRILVFDSWLNLKMKIENKEGFQWQWKRSVSTKL